MKNRLVFLSEVKSSELKFVGGKAKPLTKLIKIGIVVPSGFVIKTTVFDWVLSENGCFEKIKNILNKKNSLGEKAQKIRNLINAIKMPKDLEEEIYNYFYQLRSSRVAVRSSADCEDMKKLSWAGEFDTYISVEPENLIKRIKQCWGSLYSERALHYALNSKGVLEKRSMAVIVQSMIFGDFSGVCFTVDPISKDKNMSVIEAIYGSGELLVSGEVSPDKYWIEKDDEIIFDIEVSRQTKKITSNDFGSACLKKVEVKNQEAQKLSGKKIIEITKVFKQIERIMDQPQDIEWVIRGSDLFILQSRPITTIN